MLNITSLFFHQVNRIKQFLDNSYARETFVRNEIAKIPSGMKLLDAGAGDQKYRKFCNHLEYYAQDLGKYTIDQKKMLGSLGLGGTEGYNYGTIDFTGDIWNIDVRSETFDVVLCTEVLEHVPYPIKTIKELSRILKPGGTLILTAPSNCLRHMDPFFFSSGFSDRWYEKILLDNGLEPKAIKPIGDYFQWLAVEMFRTMRTNRFSFILIFPAFVFFAFKKATHISQNTLCFGYHVVAEKGQGNR